MTEHITKRGRPKNTGRHQSHDAQILPAIADRKLLNEHQPLAIIIRDLIDTERDTGGTRRLQRAFKAESHDLMAAARERHRLKKIEEIGDAFMRFTNTVQSVRDLLVHKIESWAQSPDAQKYVDALERFQRAANSPEGQKWRNMAEHISSVDRLRHAAIGASRSPRGPR